MNNTIKTRFGETMRRTILLLGNLGMWIAGVTLCLMMLLATADVICRHLLRRSMASAHDVTELMMVVAIFLGLAYTASVKGHVQVDLVISKLSRHAQTVLESITSFFSIVISATLAWCLGMNAWSSFIRGGVTPTVGIPISPFLYLASIGCALLCAQLLVDFYDSLLRAVGKRKVINRK